MKRSVILFATLLVSAAAFAQPSQEGRPKLQPNQIIATTGEVNATPQGSYTPDFKIDGTNAKVRNVILMIGDGMGLGAVCAGLYSNGGELTMTNLKTMGYTRTQSASDFTTDSAASGTAYATGHKTKNGYVGMGPDGERLVNIPEAITPYGYVCGVLSTDGLDGATPAAFYAHQTARGASDAIWADIPSSCLTFFSAGSSSRFGKLPLSTQEAIKGKYTVIFEPDEEAIANSEKLGYLPENVGDGRGDYLPSTTEMAIDYLSARSKKGFFLMVEGAHIDHKAHSNIYDGLVVETLDFDKAVEAAIRFAEKDGHTLVVISADHETGAVVLRKGNIVENYTQGSFSSKGHSPMMVPLFAYGPHSQDFRGVQENSDISNKIKAILIGK